MSFRLCFANVEHVVIGHVVDAEKVYFEGHEPHSHYDVFSPRLQGGYGKLANEFRDVPGKAEAHPKHVASKLMYAIKVPQTRLSR